MENNRFQTRIFHKYNSRGRFYLKPVIQDLKLVNLCAIVANSKLYFFFPSLRNQLHRRFLLKKESECNAYY